ncbi:adenylate kinase family protein [Ehrlichia chaffeensis str. Heartland]|nr:adenylate kinase family protein [Ehrlichia chaffeensis str. Heartland]AHX05748.1 adenylate kinase family protein [Ehrlichia chaffeensis str. Jax]AHX06740.1 adenylate kinase family protein [Ehrlichia chaffeensis str. Liberty]AHX07276.1 adenylate kinase family protein [Ehrlichia chaffeensis str. Osceola]AHX08862.1 adenylate kinase family protein [Ehrlichia chaffeensis str. Saint Vincent]AHX09109.1 adenylate kinase family protein [Ehrlichia chaffeensis str. Wakulla]AHX10962.1 adenylate kinase
MLIFGPPGSGKGTQCHILSKIYSTISVISTGDLLRSEAKLDTDDGRKIRQVIESGDLVSDDIVCKMFAKSISRVKSGFLLDGFPRNLSQAEFLTEILEEYNSRIDIVIQLQLDLETIKNRLYGRIVCKNCGQVSNLNFFDRAIDEIVCKFCKSSQLDYRYDDKVEVIIKRVNQYDREIKKLENYYRDKIVCIDAGKPIEEVTCDIKDKIAHLIIG